MQSNLDYALIGKLKVLEDKINKGNIEGKVVVFRGLETCVHCKQYVGMINYSCNGRNWTMLDVHNMINHNIILWNDFEEFIDDLIK